MLVAPWWSCSWRRILGSVAVRPFSSSSGWVRSPTRLLLGTLHASIPSTFTARTWGKSPARRCVPTFRTKSYNRRGVFPRQGRTPVMCPLSLNPTPTRGESGPLNPPLWCTAPAKTLTPHPHLPPPPPRSVKTERGTWGRPKGPDPPEHLPLLAVWCPTTIPPWPATKHDPPSRSSAPWAAPATCTSQTWAWLSTARRTASSTCPSSHLGPSTAASSTWAET